MITINNLTMGFTERTLFKDVSLSIFKNEKIGLTGPNGAGKTTLFHIIRGEMEPVAGNIQIQKNINVGYLPQEAKFSSTKTVMEELTEGDERIRKLMDEKRRLEDEHKAHTDRYGDVMEQLEILGIYELEHKAEKILSGLGFKEADFHKPIAQLSGGWQMRTLLAKLLVYPFDLLLLDEPTNYLDLSATLWLKDYLSGYNGAFVLISHDRVFLNDVTNYTIILESTRMTKVKGNFETYEQQKEINLKALEKKQKVVDKKRQQLERFTQRFHAQPNRASAVRNKRKMIERLEKVELPQERLSIGQFKFDEIEPSGYQVLLMKDISKSYGEKKVYEQLNFEITKGQKVCLVGPNGAGKSTLLKMLAGMIQPDGGTIKMGHNVERGYFSQTRMDVLNSNRSALEEVFDSAPGGTQNQRVRDLLGLFNYHGDDVFKLVKVLSGGEKSRLILAKLLINPPNFMLLDEPTTHLDVDGVKALTTAFKDYEGTMCFISHDLYFIKEVADTIVDIDNGVIKVYPGGLEYYLHKKAPTLAGARSESRLSGANIGKGRSKKKPKKLEKNDKQKVSDQPEKESLKEMWHKHKEAKNRLAQIKKEIKALDDEKKELETESYIKSRKLSECYDQRDAALIKELGNRLKEIQSRQREIATTLKELGQEKKRLS